MNLYESILLEQKQYLDRVQTIDVAMRIAKLQLLKETIKKQENNIMEALKKDLGKSNFEAFLNEIGFLYKSIDHTKKNLKKWVRPKKIKNDIAQIFGKSLVYPSHYGVVLIIGPYNYPFQLLIEPLIGAIAGGNTAVLKPSEFTPNVEKVIIEIIEAVFERNYVSVVTGDHQVNSALLDLPFDYIFFTGSVPVGKIVMEKASKHLIPVTLELGGKSPVIVHNSANLKIAAKRILWGKLINAGQTCIAPDYVMAHEDIVDELCEVFRKTILEFYGEDPIHSKDFGRIINEKHMNRLAAILEHDREKIIFGGDLHRAERFIAPTLLKDITLEDMSMKEELFGPILPIMSYRTMDDIKTCIAANPKPLALYVFSEDASFSEDIITRFSFGGGCVNDTILHVASNYLPFGGVGTSGIGRYHGKSSFHTFTYEKSIVKRSSKIDMTLLFPPYKNKFNLVKKLIR